MGINSKQNFLDLLKTYYYLLFPKIFFHCSVLDNVKPLTHMISLLLLPPHLRNTFFIKRYASEMNHNHACERGSELFIEHSIKLCLECCNKKIQNDTYE